MIEISSLTAMIVAEVMLGLLVLSGLMLLFTLFRKQRIRKAANHLAGRVQSDKEKRTERLKKLLQERYQMQSPQLDQTLHGIMQTEMTLFQNLLNGFLKDDQLSLQQIDVDVENLVLGYQALGGYVSEAGNPEGGASSDEVETLKEENERLAEELKVTMDTMGRMLNEYSTMFADGDGGFPAAAASLTEQESAEPAEEASVAPEMAAEVVVDTPAESEQSVAESDSRVDDEMVIPDMSEAELTESSLSELAEDRVEHEIERGAEAETDQAILQADTPDVEIPDSEMAEVAIPDVDSVVADSVGVDEEVSEIIDEVMEIADDMMTADTESQAEPGGESLVDDLKTIDIEIPEMDSSEVEQAEFEPGSLEEEWAKLLEEESTDEEKKDV
jgi:hypothetical protein